MADKQKSVPFPSREQVAEFIRLSPGKVGKREIARAFHIRGQDRPLLKKLLRQMEKDGMLEKGDRKSFRQPGDLPSVTVLKISRIDKDGELFAIPVSWEGEGDGPEVNIVSIGRGSAPGLNDKVLARCDKDGEGGYRGKVIRRLERQTPGILAVARQDAAGNWRLKSIDRRDRDEFAAVGRLPADLVAGTMVRAEVLNGRELGLKPAKIVEVLGDMSGPGAITDIVIKRHGILDVFPDAATQEAEKAKAAPPEGRVDLRKVPLVTIDGEDARDFDDAVFAEPDDDPDNPGGFHLIIAIADVAWYVRPGSPLDKAAFERGNSTYFPDRAVPMLPEVLSNGWCSLMPREDRPCMVAHIWISAKGAILRSRIERGLMNSVARLTYKQVQRAQDGFPDPDVEVLLKPVIAPLYDVFRALETARRSRGVMELDLPERQIILNEDGAVDRIQPRERLDSHKLIEEFMICANVAVADALVKKRRATVFRIHDQPGMEKLESLRQFLEGFGLSLTKGVIRTGDFNNILQKVVGAPHQGLVNQVVLRSQSQAAYSPDNIGHFGLALVRYCHFTSPIRRYADLMVHRALIDAFDLGPGGVNYESSEDLVEPAEHISVTERRSSDAERDSTDRYIASFLADRVGADFEATVSGVTRFGLFMALKETGADGLVPISSLPDDYYDHDAVTHRLTGNSAGRVYALGDDFTVRLVEASPVTGGMLFEILNHPKPGPGARRGRGRGKGHPPRHKRRR